MQPQSNRAWRRERNTRRGGSAAHRRRLTLDRLEDRSLMAVAYSPALAVTGPSGGRPLEVALQYLSTSGAQFGVSPGDVDRLAVTDQYTDTVGAKATHIYLRQGYKGLTIDNANLSVTVMPDGSILSVFGSFVPGLDLASQSLVVSPRLSATDALLAAAPALQLDGDFTPQIRSVSDGVDQATTLIDPDLSLDPIPAMLRYVYTNDGNVELTWDFVVRTPDNQHWYDISVDASAGTILRQADWVDHYSAKYNVYALPIKSPLYGDRTILTDPADLTASPNGWHSTNSATTAEFTTTRGNNVNAYEDSANTNAPGNYADGGASLNFDFPIDYTKAPSTYVDAAITSEFYLVNMSHDLHYKYGFTEAAGNFQVNNFTNGGVGNDPVQAEAQDGGGMDNANMATPPDGTSPRMQMYIFDITNPYLDGDLDAEVVTHEFGHGVSNRLTGGPANASALQTNQSGGMGEGWSDFWALMFTQLPTDTKNTPRPVGAWLNGAPAGGPGIRRFSYSYDMGVNPQTFADYNTDTSYFGGPEPHNTGELWTQVLWDMNWNLINKFGFDPDLKKGYQTGGAGNLLALQLVMDGLKIQPVNPTFIEARDAILAADKALTGGENQPEIWEAFARRGLGLSASTSNSDSTVVNTATDMPVFMTIDLNLPTGLTEHQPITTNTVIGTVVDPSNPGPASQYQVTIDWGDGKTPTPGTLVPTGVGTFNLVADKTYDQGGMYGVKATLLKIGSVTTKGSAQITIKDLPISVTANNIAADEGIAFSGQLATFVDSDPTPSAPSLYRATVTWDDATTSLGTVTQNSLGHYAVSATRVFHGGVHAFTVNVTGPGGGTSSDAATATVTNSTLLAFPTTIDATEGTAFTGLVATFTDADPSHPPVSYSSADIAWGDGTTSRGTIVPLSSGTFGVMATHIFTVGAISVVVTIKDSDLSQAATTSTGNAANAPIYLSASDVQLDEGFPSNVLLGTFQDTNILSGSADFRLMVDWGDDTDPTEEQVVWNGRGNYVLAGQHSYTYTGTAFAITLTLEEIKADRTNPTAPPTVVGTYVATAQAYVNNAHLSANGRTITAVEGAAIPPSTVLSTFIDQNPTGLAGDYTATINWGNGQTSPGIVNATDTPGSVQVGAAGYSFPVAGSYSYTVQVLDNAGTPVNADGLVTVTDAPLTGINENAITATEATSTGPVLVGSFDDSNRSGQLNQFSATIYWGDGSTSPGLIVGTGTAGRYQVVGTHTYANPGTYTTAVGVTSAQGSTTTMTGTAWVADLILPLAGQIDPMSDTGASSADGVTKAANIIFRGTAQANSVIHLYAQPARGGDGFAVGTTGSDATGSWALGSSALPSGDYRFYAQATDADNRPGSVLTPLNIPGRGGSILIDNSSPTVSGVTFDPRSSAFRVTFDEPVAGLDLNGLLASSNYSVLQGRRTVNPSSVTLDPSDASSVLVRFHLGRPRGIYQLTMNSSGLRDLAGNVLDERYYVAFPGTTHSPGENYVARFNTNGRTATGPMLVTPPNQLQAARQFSRFLMARVRRFR
jgi:extracellular elastinolytic metalloproteinase